MKVICIDDSAKPNEVSSRNWIKKGTEYNATWLYRNALSGEQHFELQEVKPDAPYAGYKITRFSFNHDDMIELINEVHNLTPETV